MQISFHQLQRQDDNAPVPMTRAHSKCVNSLVFSDDERFLASASCDKTVKLWAVERGELFRTLEGHQDCVTSVIFSPDSKTVVSASCDRTVKIWDIDTGECSRTLKGHQDCVTSVMFLPGTKQLVSASCDNTVGIWNTESWSFIRVALDHQNCDSAFARSAGLGYTAFVSGETSIKLRGADSSQREPTLPEELAITT